MKVAVYHNNNDIRLEERPTPKISEGEILIKVKASGICGTDVMEWYRIKKAPRILGHEIAGDVVESKSDKFKVGDKVFVSHHVPCNECKYCLEGNHTACETLHKGNYDPGGFSEFIRIPKINVDNGTYIIPFSYEEGTMIEPLACVVRGQRIIDLKKQHTVLILGSGISGLMNIQLAKEKGAKVIATDIDGYRLKKAKEFGADQVIDVSETYPCSREQWTKSSFCSRRGHVSEHVKNHPTKGGTSKIYSPPQRVIFNVSKQELNLKADRIIVCTGAMQAVKQAFDCIDKKGTILFFAIPPKNIEIPTVDFWRNEITITSSYGAAPVDLQESLELIKQEKINVKAMITHKLPLEDIQKGFKIVSDAKESLKVILTL